VARLKWVYLGGGSTRAPGTMASFVAQGQNFAGSEVVLVDLDEERLELVAQLTRKFADTQNLELTVRTTTNRIEALSDADAVLSSFRPGGFEMRYLDESIPLKHGVIGQETQGPGGFFMALRSINIIKEVVSEMEKHCPKAVLFNYTNPVNIVAEAVTHHSPIQTISLCDGPITFPRELASAAGLDPAKVDATMTGLNHACWSVRHLYEGKDIMPLIREAYERKRADLEKTGERYWALWWLELATTMDSLPASYFQYYYYKDECLADLKAKPTTRAQDISKAVPGYWEHYVKQLELPVPKLDPAQSRGGIHELELAFDVMDAIYNDRQEVWPVNIPNRGALPDFPDDLVVEVPALIGAQGVTPLVQPPLPRAVSGLVKQLGEYQALTAQAAWCGDRKGALQALTSHPLMLSLPKTEAIYSEMAHSMKAYLPERLW
jgi:6-phospho-beta-glucosidase